MAPLLVGVIMGGPSAEHEISLASGRTIAITLGHTRHCVRPIVVTQQGTWRVLGRDMDPARALAGLDAVLLALHGEWGEDGRVQLLLEAHGIPYTGSGVFASALAIDKWVSRSWFQAAGLAIPKAVLVTHDAVEHFHDASGVLQELPQGPWVVKPVSRGSSVGVSVVDDILSLPYALDHAFQFQDRAIVEEYIDGVEVSCGVLEDTEGTPCTLPVTEICPPKDRYRFFDYDAKYSGDTEEIIPARVSKNMTHLIQDAALRAYHAVGCRHYARVDMIVKDNIPKVLELNTLPGLTRESLLPKQAHAAGYSFPSFLEHLLARTLA